MSEGYKLYLDQMFGVDVAQALGDEGYDVSRASETQQDRGDDQEILQKAIGENRILIRLDEHFGDWAILPLSRHSWVIRTKVYPTTSERVLNLLLPFLRMHTQEKFKNHLVIVSEKRGKWIHTA